MSRWRSNYKVKVAQWQSFMSKLCVVYSIMWEMTGMQAVSMWWTWKYYVMQMPVTLTFRLSLISTGHNLRTASQLEVACFLPTVRLPRWTRKSRPLSTTHSLTTPSVHILCWWSVERRKGWAGLHIGFVRRRGGTLREFTSRCLSASTVSILLCRQASFCMKSGDSCSLSQTTQDCIKRADQYRYLSEMLNEAKISRPEARAVRSRPRLRPIFRERGQN